MRLWKEACREAEAVLRAQITGLEAVGVMQARLQSEALASGGQTPKGPLQQLKQESKTPWRTPQPIAPLPETPATAVAASGWQALCSEAEEAGENLDADFNLYLSSDWNVDLLTLTWLMAGQEAEPFRCMRMLSLPGILDASALLFNGVKRVSALGIRVEIWQQALTTMSLIHVAEPLYTRLEEDALILADVADDSAEAKEEEKVWVDDGTLPLGEGGVLPFYFMDAHEEPGAPDTVYLFGKVSVLRPLFQ